MPRNFPRLLNSLSRFSDSPFFLFSSNWVCFTNFGRTLSEHPRNSSIISEDSKDSLPRPVFLLLSTIALYLSNSALHFSFIWAKLLELPMPTALQCSVKVSELFSHADFFPLLLLELFRFSWYRDKNLDFGRFLPFVYMLSARTRRTRWTFTAGRTFIMTCRYIYRVKLLITRIDY